MDEIILKADLDENTAIYISPIARQTYDEHVADDNLGGDRGYFLVKSSRIGERKMEVLAKLATFEAAFELFDLIAPSRRALAR